MTIPRGVTRTMEHVNLDLQTKVFVVFVLLVSPVKSVKQVRQQDSLFYFDKADNYSD